jgi:hypothetical protein
MFAWLAISKKAFLRLCVLLGGLALLSGCTHVIGNNAPYYKSGPAQREGPQGTIPAGTPVWVLGKEGSYAHVWTTTGVDGFVWENAVVTKDEWNRRQSLDKQNEEATRRARAKGSGPLEPSEPAPPAQGANRPPPKAKTVTPPRTPAGGPSK